jgi:hypothetical protein
MHLGRRCTATAQQRYSVATAEAGRSTAEVAPGRRGCGIMEISHLLILGFLLGLRTESITCMVFPGDPGSPGYLTPLLTAARNRRDR